MTTMLKIDFKPYLGVHVLGALVRLSLGINIAAARN